MRKALGSLPAGDARGASPSRKRPLASWLCEMGAEFSLGPVTSRAALPTHPNTQPIGPCTPLVPAAALSSDALGRALSGRPSPHRQVSAASSRDGHYPLCCEA